MKITTRRRLIFFLVLTLFACILALGCQTRFQVPCPLFQNAVSASSFSDYGLSNPFTDNTGIVTWDCVYFGNYWQNDTNNDGKADKNDQKEPIKWRLLSINGDDAFLLADQNLDAQVYNDEWTSVTWETCTMRSWLNGYGASENAQEKDYSRNNFIENAFDVSEQSAIKITNVLNNQNNPMYNSINGGNDTQDKIYLLSIEEAMNPDYGFTSSENATETRKSTNTAYTANGGEINSSEIQDAGRSDFWWLRSPGNNHNNIANVYTSGNIYMTGNAANLNQLTVRPALHLNLTSSSVWSYAGKVTSEGKIIAPVTPTPSNPPAAPTMTPTPSATVTSPIVTLVPSGTTASPVATSSTSTLPTVTPKITKTPVSSANPEKPATEGKKPQSTPVVSPKISPSANPPVKSKKTGTSVSAPSKVTGLSLKPAKRKLRVKWKKISKVKGYQIWYSTSKKFKIKKQKLVKKNTVTLKKLKKRKTYYVKIRAYKLNGKKKVYGKWSSVKKKKTDDSRRYNI